MTEKEMYNIHREGVPIPRSSLTLFTCTSMTPHIHQLMLIACDGLRFTRNQGNTWFHAQYFENQEPRNVQIDMGHPGTPHGLT